MIAELTEAHCLLASVAELLALGVEKAALKVLGRKVGALDGGVLEWSELLVGEAVPGGGARGEALR